MQNTFNQTRSSRCLLAVTALCGIAQSVPALADAPAAPPAFSWTGVYVGVTGGHTTGESTWNGPSDAGQFGGNDTDIIHNRSFTYGGEIGYNYQLPHGLLVGLEGSVQGSHQASGNSYTGGEGYSGYTAIAVRNHFGGDVSARFGATFDRLLIYGKVGVAFSHADYTATVVEDQTVTTTLTRARVLSSPHLQLLASAPAGVYTGSQDQTGLLVGGGMEFALTRNWSVKAEYNHIGNTTKNVGLTSTGSSTYTTPIGGTDNTFKFGVNYRF